MSRIKAWWTYIDVYLEYRKGGHTHEYACDRAREIAYWGVEF